MWLCLVVKVEKGMPFILSWYLSEEFPKVSVRIPIEKLRLPPLHALVIRSSKKLMYAFVCFLVDNIRNIYDCVQCDVFGQRMIILCVSDCMYV